MVIWLCSRITNVWINFLIILEIKWYSEQSDNYSTTFLIPTFTNINNLFKDHQYKEEVPVSTECISTQGHFQNVFNL